VPVLGKEGKPVDVVVDGKEGLKVDADGKSEEVVVGSPNPLGAPVVVDEGVPNGFEEVVVGAPNGVMVVEDGVPKAGAVVFDGAPNGVMVLAEVGVPNRVAVVVVC